MRLRNDTRGTPPAEWIEWFAWSSDDTFTASYFYDEPAFPSVEAAKAAWPRCRLAMWNQTHRFQVPHAAEVFDGITLNSRQHLLSAWYLRGPFDLVATLEVLASDRAHLSTFERRERIAAAELSDVLTLFRADMAAIETAARDLAAWSGEDWRRPYPGHAISSAKKYGD